MRMPILLEHRRVFEGHHHDTSHAGGIAATLPHDAPGGVADKSADTATPASATSPSTHDRSRAEQANAARVNGERETGNQANATLANAALANAPSVLFVDSRVDNWRELTSGLSANVHVVVIRPGDNAFATVSSAVANRSGLASIQFLSYGTDGSAELGATMFNAASVMDQASAVAAWGTHLGTGGQILFWGCDVGAGQDGRMLVEDLHRLTGANVAASANATGDAAEGGDWTLETRSGDFTVRDLFTRAARAAYDGVLDVPDPAVTISGDATALLGNSFTQTLSFSNRAGSAAGYGPYVEMFVPHTQNSSATVQSMTYLGQALATKTVTLSTTVAGHVGTLGALDPFAVDKTGHPVFVVAPAGYQAGDELVAARLPFASYAPGTPAASIVVTLTADTSSTPGATLNIDAIGGFMYGADAQNNPATDPSIRGTGVASASDPADGLATSTVNLNLLNIQTQALTTKDGELAAGPSHVGIYEVQITPAAATTGDPIRNVDLTVALPADVQYTGGTINVTGSDGKVTAVPATTNPGGTVTLHFASLSAADGMTKVDIPFYVPETDASGRQIVNETTGASANIVGPTVTYNSAVNWTAPSGTVVTVDGSDPNAPTSAAFIARAVAVQITSATDNNAAVAAGSNLTYNMAVQVSNYNATSNLTLTSRIDDEQSVNPAIAPVFTWTDVSGQHSISLGLPDNPVSATQNGQVVSTSGSNSYWNYTRNADGSTSLAFNISQALLANGYSGELPPGVSGNLSYGTTVLSGHTNAPINQASGKPAMIEEGDTLSGTAGLSGTLLDKDGAQQGTTPVSETESGSTTLSVAKGSVTLKIVAINGKAVPDGTTPQVQPGDAVTYEADYQTITGNYTALNLSSYLPSPVFNVVDPNSDGGTTGYTDATDSSTYPSSGGYRLVNAPSGVVISKMTTDATNNALSFDLSGYQSATATTTPEKLGVQFTLTATQQPFANDLVLNALEQGTMTTSTDSMSQTYAPARLTVQNPDLTTTTGIASVATASGAEDGGVTYTNQISGDVTARPSEFATAGSSSVFNTGATPEGIAPATNEDARNLVGSETVRVAQTVQNNGSGAAYDVTVSGALPTGVETSQITNFQIVREDGTVLVTADASGNLLGAVTSAGTQATIADYFSDNGVQVEAPGGSGNAVLMANGSPADALVVVYDVATPPNVGLGQDYVFTGTIVNYAAVTGGVKAGNGFVSNGVPTSISGAVMTDTATVSSKDPTISMQVGTSNMAADDHLADASNASAYAVGETRPFSVTVSVPPGQLSNGTGDVQVKVAIPSHEEVDLSSVTVTLGNGLTATLPPSAVSLDASGNLVVDLGPSVLASGSGDDDVTINFNASFPLSHNLDGKTGTQENTSASLIYSGAPVQSNTITMQEVDPDVVTTLTPDNGSHLQSGEIVTYTYTATNRSGAVAADFQDTLTIPDGYVLVPGSLVNDGSMTVAASSDGTTIHIGGNDQALTGTGSTGATESFTFQVKVADNLASGTRLTIASQKLASGTTTASHVPASLGTVGGYESIPYSTSTTGKWFATSVSATATIDSFSDAHLEIVGEAAGVNSGTVIPDPTYSHTEPTSANVVPGDVVRLQGSAHIPEGRNTDTTVTITVPSGLTIPAASANLTIALISPGGDTTSDIVDPDGNIPGLQVTSTTATDVTLIRPTYTLPAGDWSITTHDDGTSSLVINLGTLVNNDQLSGAHAVALAFNAVVDNSIANIDASSLHVGMQVTANGSATPITTNTAHLTVVTPALGLTQAEGPAQTAQDLALGIVQMQATLKNTGDATAYNAQITGLIGPNETYIPGSERYTITNADGTTSTGTLTVGTDPSDGHPVFSLPSLAAGQTLTLLYQARITDIAQPVAEHTAVATAQDMDPAITEYQGTAIGAVGSAEGPRDGTLSSPQNNIRAASSSGIGVVTGQVYEVIGRPDTWGTFDPNLDTPLGGVPLSSVDATGQKFVYTTDASGNYIATPLFDGTTILTLPDAGSGNPVTVPANATQVAGLAIQSDGHWMLVETPDGRLVTGQNVVYELPDTAPVISGFSRGTVTVAGGSTNLISNGAGVNDAEIARLVAAYPSEYGYNGAVLSVSRVSAAGVATPDANDVFGGQSGLSFGASGAVMLNGTQVGTYTQGGGTLKITFGVNAAEVQQATVQSVLNDITWTNTAEANQFQFPIAIGVTLSDGNTDNSQGTGGVMTSAVAITTFHTSASGQTDVTFVEPNDATPTPTPLFTAATAPGVVAPAATAVFTLGNAQTGDALVFSGAGDVGDIVATVGADGSLHLASASNGATTAQWNRALADVGFVNMSDTPDTAVSRTVALSVTDAATGDITTANAVATVNVIAANDSPVLGPVADDVVPAREDATSPPSATAGVAVSSLVTSVIDPDANGVHDGAVGVAMGIAVVGADTSKGNWYYSTDAGRTWTLFASASTAAISSGNALFLAGGPDTRIAFVPTTTDYNGTIGDALQFKAWDGFDPHANGSTGALPATLGAAAALNSPGTSYSAQTDTLIVNVAAVNDAPVATGNVTLPPMAEDTTNPPDASVSSLFTHVFNDSRDQQVSASNPDGSSANDLVGIAIVGNTVPAADGVWRYSTDGGATWTAVATNVSDTNATVLSPSALLSFLPAPNWNGTPPALTSRLIDSSNGPVADATGVDVSVNGGTTAISANFSALSTVVTPVNDAPLATGNVTLPPVPEDTANPSGASVASLFTPVFNDQTDAVPGGSSANDLAGIAIVGNTVPATDGVWRYSTDGGATWTAVATNVSDTNATVLPSSALISFLPAPNWNGTPPALTTRLIDSSSGAVTAETGVDVSANGGITAISAGTSMLSTAVTPVNDAPVTTGHTPPAMTVAEDTTTPPGISVSTLFGPSFNDQTDAVPGGSSANDLAGVVITKNDTPASDGTWVVVHADGSRTPVGAVSETNGLVVSASDRLAFVPAPNWNGTPDPLTVHLIDSSSGAVTTGTHIDATKNGGTTAISIGTVDLPAIVQPVNDAPLATGNVTLPPVPEDTANPSGASVASLFTPVFNDQTDAVPGGSSANDLAGIAIVGNTVPATDGVWRYSTDGGATWTVVATNVSDTNAIVLPSSALISFLPAPNWNGTPPALTTRLIDSSSGPVTAGTGEDVSANGGITAISAGTSMLSTVVTPVNDAPVATGNATLPPVSADTTNPPGASVASLFTPVFNDQTDAVPGGSSANNLAGIAIVGNTVPATEGVWRYSTDGGATWTAVATNVSDTNAIVLPSSALLSFLPAPNWNGTPPALMARLIDSSSGPVAAGTGVDVSANGGITAISANLSALSTVVTMRARNPVLSDDTQRNGFSEEALTGKATWDLFDRYDRDNVHRLGTPMDAGWVAGFVSRSFVQAGSHFSIPVVDDDVLGASPHPDENWTMDVRMQDGAPLPAWLIFDPVTRRFEGDPPEGESCDLVLHVELADGYGHRGFVEMFVHVQGEMDGLMSRLLDDRAMSAPSRAQAPRQRSTLHDRLRAHHQAARHGHGRHLLRGGGAR
ncbi:DUF4347 domain-containing protein [Novacetimonas hansenii]|uniref:DUF4347 domain-containing protein n=1 Tax=Novacetimonas hansenii TaxID=436 RepID=UPI00178488B5|nr:DUF4347 domain-containing protein [Novacetimonas hansenii]QOF95693.1 DUF4347 domain-containing protein [Novacetimonas hansenii]